MITVWNLLNTGLIAIEASIQLNLSTGLGIVGVLSSNGSIISEKPTSNQEPSQPMQTEVNKKYLKNKT